jgi:hypothetical protein
MRPTAQLNLSDGQRNRDASPAQSRHHHDGLVWSAGGSGLCPGRTRLQHGEVRQLCHAAVLCLRLRLLLRQQHPGHRLLPHRLRQARHVGTCGHHRHRCRQHHAHVDPRHPGKGRTWYGGAHVTLPHPGLRHHPGHARAARSTDCCHHRIRSGSRYYLRFTRATLYPVHGLR